MDEPQTSPSPQSSSQPPLAIRTRSAGADRTLSERACTEREAAAFVSELHALFVGDPSADRAELAFRALRVVTQVSLYEALEGAVLLARSRHAHEAPPDQGDLVSALGRSTWAFVRASGERPTLPFAGTPLLGTQDASRAGR